MTYHTSLLTAVDARSHVHLIVGSNPPAASRCGQSLSAGASPILIAPETAELSYALQRRIEDGEVTWLRKSFQDSDVMTLGRAEVGSVVDAVFVTCASQNPSGAHISAFCKRNRVPVNVVDAPQLCTFSLLSAYTDGPLQIGVTTNGRGCKLASRIRRELASSLPKDLGKACLRLGDVRKRIQQEDDLLHNPLGDGDDIDDSVDQSANFNRPTMEADRDAAKNRRMRWLSQVCEYWPLRRLAAISDEDVATILRSYTGAVDGTPESADRSMPPSYPDRGSRGCIVLAGSGPGHPDLLTRATHKAIQGADLVLADKLVPSGVLDLIPRRTPVQIARKFPGNADAAQEELLEMAISGVRAGKVVLRLKQGDPYIFGRGGEEVEYFRNHELGDRVIVLPGITSALSAPLFANIPPTQRDVADQVLICTGTGKKGKPPAPPEYLPSRTVVFLMALHRISGLVAELSEYVDAELPAEEDGGRKPRRSLWPRLTPCAVVERASCRDQRVIRTTLGRVVEAVEQEGSRPPGLLVIGKACDFLNILEEGRAWAVEDGFSGLELSDALDMGNIG